MISKTAVYGYPMASKLHTLVAGTTGSGKSVYLNGLIRMAREHRRSLVLCDPKRVEFTEYKNEVLVYANTPEKIEHTLGRVLAEVEGRFTRMEKRGLRFSDEPTLVVIIDELADLMLQRKKTVLPLLTRILAISRAANVQVIAATQVPNRKIIPAELVLNFPVRVGLRCMSAIESRQVVGVSGCEKLPRYGRCIITCPEGTTELEVPFYEGRKEE